MSFAIFYASEFKRNVRKLLKKYPRLPQDIDGFIQLLHSGELIGDLLQHIGYSVYKVRVNNKGKSAGYRMIYYAVQHEKIVLLTLYSKSEQSDIDAKTICKIIDEWHEE